MIYLFLLDRFAKPSKRKSRAYRSITLYTTKCWVVVIGELQTLEVTQIFYVEPNFEVNFNAYPHDLKKNILIFPMSMHGLIGTWLMNRMECV